MRSVCLVDAFDNAVIQIPSTPGLLMYLKLLSTAVASVIATVLTVGAMTYSKPTKAVAASAPSGACGGTFSFARKGKPRNSDGDGVNALAYFNFDTKSMEIQITYTGDNFSANRTYITSTSADVIRTTFTLVAGEVTGSWQIVPVANIPRVNLLPVNGGNTFLMQAVNDDIVGMCQRI